MPATPRTTRATPTPTPAPATFLTDISKALGLPDHIKSLTITVDAAGTPTLDVTYEVPQDDLLAVLKKYELSPVASTGLTS